VSNHSEDCIDNKKSQSAPGKICPWQVNPFNETVTVATSIMQNAGFKAMVAW